ncbi:hypothetical protein AB0K35_27610 [Micromonospora sp. NPDC053740]|uniref:hypothetical protein n=1 Tax=Micromonospora sp. NPDC053740 TaxID=3155173 RepID=UPI003430DBFF
MATTTEAVDERIERAARALAYFEGSDAFDQPDTPDCEVARDVYRTRVAALLARTVPASQRGARPQPPAVRPDPVLAWSFNRHITADQLAALAPGEITALFGALNTIAAVTQHKPTGGTA